MPRILPPYPISDKIIKPKVDCRSGRYKPRYEDTWIQRIVKIVKLWLR